MRKVLITGVAGFIGYHLAKRLIAENIFVIGIDNMNDYYSVELKKDRLKNIGERDNFLFIEASIENMDVLEDCFKDYKPDIVINLAAQAGVRYSIENPKAYIDSNVIGFFNMLECCRRYPVKHLIFASSSSVYGANKKVPYSTKDKVDTPVSLYAATKKTDELLAYSYSKLYKIKTTGLRFFTVYGPFGRPDMAYFSLTSVGSYAFNGCTMLESVTIPTSVTTIVNYAFTNCSTDLVIKGYKYLIMEICIGILHI